MNRVFSAATDEMPQLFDRLNSSIFFTEKGIASQKGKAGVYAFFEGGLPVHVGRTRNLAGRLRGHITRNHFSASFAFKRARRELGKQSTYTSKGSRAELVNDVEFRECFHRHIECVRLMSVRFLAVPDPVQQYLLELYAHMEYELPLDEFDTH